METKHHLIVAHAATNLGYDRDALTMMARGDAIETIANKGYYKSEEIIACEQQGIALPFPSRTRPTLQLTDDLIEPASPMASK